MDVLDFLAGSLCLFQTRLDKTMSRFLDSRLSCLTSRFSSLDSRFSVSDSRFSILASRLFASELSILDFRFSAFWSSFSVLNSWCWFLDSRSSILGSWYSIFHDFPFSFSSLDSRFSRVNPRLSSLDPQFSILNPGSFRRLAAWCSCCLFRLAILEFNSSILHFLPPSRKALASQSSRVWCSQWFSIAQFGHPDSDSGLNKADYRAILHIFVSLDRFGPRTLECAMCNVRQYTILTLLVLQSLVVLLRWVMDLGLL